MVEASFIFRQVHQDAAVAQLVRHRAVDLLARERATPESLIDRVSSSGQPIELVRREIDMARKEVRHGICPARGGCTVASYRPIEKVGDAIERRDVVGELVVNTLA